MIVVGPTSGNRTTDRTSAELARHARRAVEVTRLTYQTDVWTYELPDHTTVNLVVTRRGGRIARAFTTSPRGPVIRYTGTPARVSQGVLTFCYERV